MSDPWVPRIVRGALALLGGLALVAALDGFDGWRLGLLVALGGAAALVVGVAQPASGAGEQHRRARLTATRRARRARAGRRAGRRARARKRRLVPVA